MGLVSSIRWAPGARVGRGERNRVDNICQILCASKVPVRNETIFLGGLLPLHTCVLLVGANALDMSCFLPACWCSAR